MESKVEIGGIEYILASDDNYLEQMGKSFEPELARLFRSLARGTALDIGANIGCTALLLSQLAETVHAFEPSPSTFEFLSQNTRAAANVFTHNLGLGDASGEHELTHAANNRSGGFVSDAIQTSPGHITERITIKTLDEVVDSLGLTKIDFIKMDVEGFEGHVVRGGTSALSRFRPAVLLEMNHWCLNAFQRTSIPDFLDQMRAAFPRLYAVQRDTYLDLHDPSESYMVMYKHILHGEYVTLVGAFTDETFSQFRDGYAHRAYS